MILTLRSPVIIGGGGGGAPTPSGTIVLDTRAGGAQSIQTATTIGQMQSAYGAAKRDTPGTGGQGSFYSADVDGLGTKARGCQWANDTGSEQECYWATEASQVIAPASGWYTQFKIRLGKSSTGGGTGTVDQWTLTGGNPHFKMFIWTRGSGTERIYFRILPTFVALTIDGLGFNSPQPSVNPYGRTGIQKLTFYISPNSGVMQMWVDETQVLNATGQSIGSTGLLDVQESITCFPGQQEVSYMWDTVVWY